MSQPIPHATTRSTVVNVLAAAFLLGSMPAKAAGWLWEPTVGAEVSYDDNIRLEATDPDSVLAVRLAGRVTVHRKTEISEMAGSVRVDAVDYSQTDMELENKSNQLLEFDGVRFGERSRFNFEGSLRRDTLLRTTEAFATPEDIEVDPDDDVDVGLVTTSVRRNRLVLRPGWQYNLSRRHAAGTAYRLNYVYYGDTETTGLSDYRDHTLVFYSDYGLTEIDRLQSRIEFKRYDALDFEGEYDSVALLAGVTHEFTELMSGGFEAGFHQTDFDTGAGSEEEDGVLLRLFGKRDMGLTRFSGRASKTLFPSGGGDLIQSDELTFNMVRDLSERMRFSLRTRVFENESLRRDNPAVNRRYLSLEPKLSWRVTRWWSLEASYRYRRQKRDTDTESATSNAVYLSAYYSVPLGLD